MNHLLLYDSVRKKFIFAQSKFRMFKHSVEKEKRENLLCKQILVSSSQLVS